MCLGHPVLGLEARRAVLVSPELPGLLPPCGATVALQLPPVCPLFRAPGWPLDAFLSPEKGGWLAPRGRGCPLRGGAAGTGSAPSLGGELAVQGPRLGSQGCGQDHTGEDGPFYGGSGLLRPPEKVFLSEAVRNCSGEVAVNY